MKSYQLIHQLINLVAELEEENQGQEVSIQDFTGFLLNKVGDPTGNSQNSEVRFGNSDSAALDIAYQLDNNIGRLFVFMSRYARSYIKKALEGTPLQTAEDFTALAILLTHTHLSKSELISPEKAHQWKNPTRWKEAKGRRTYQEGTAPSFVLAQPREIEVGLAMGRLFPFIALFRACRRIFDLAARNDHERPFHRAQGRMLGHFFARRREVIFRTFKLGWIFA